MHPGRRVFTDRRRRHLPGTRAPALDGHPLEAGPLQANRVLGSASSLSAGVADTDAADVQGSQPLREQPEGSDAGSLVHSFAALPPDVLRSIFQLVFSGAGGSSRAEAEEEVAAPPAVPLHLAVRQWFALRLTCHSWADVLQASPSVHAAFSTCAIPAPTLTPLYLAHIWKLAGCATAASGDLGHQHRLPGLAGPAWGAGCAVQPPGAAAPAR